MYCFVPQPERQTVGNAGFAQFWGSLYFCYSHVPFKEFFFVMVSADTVDWREKKWNLNYAGHQKHSTFAC